MEQRQNPRFPVRFRSSFTSLNIVGGEGNIIDLSLRGCRVESQTEVRPGTSLEIRIETAEEEPPLNFQLRSGNLPSDDAMPHSEP